MVLSQIERQIKEKIERVGTPLKDWDIQINYGIKTGFNEAFIIDGKKRQELINQDPKSAEIIRPILRGRDIKRYSYDFSDKYLITTFPSLKIDINKYPSVKNFMEGFKPKLQQTGELLTDLEKEQVLKHAKNQGIDISESDLKKSRKKTNNKWFETQDSISYWEDFSIQKIVWKRVGSILRFAYDDKGYFALDSTCFATGNSIKSLVAILNSKLGNYLLQDSPKTGTGDLLISVQAIEPIRVPIVSEEVEDSFNTLVNLMIMTSDEQKEETEDLINQKVYQLYGLVDEEIKFIESL